MVEEFESLHVVCHLDSVLTQRGLSLTELSRRVDVSLANLSVLKNNRAKAIRYSTLIALCQVLDCQPGDLFTVNVRPD
ncbi:helix-turn-helix transcriptional regulator [Brevibacterium antiquum]|uniref:helix-turn-helix domain-containing protein n=1 Tax=Brevibacterium antiquum TaxID=234835 RepID=UPI0018E05CCC|nr:helix-turn-helix domain-containing protein [Brevibacterium antiquum]